MQKLNDWFQEHQTFVGIVGPGGSALCALGVRYATNRVTTALFLALLVLVASVPSLAARVNRLQQGRRASELCIKRVLQACAYAFGYPDLHIRANIMRFSPDRQRRHVQHSTGFNMNKDSDCDLEIDVNAGVSGQAVLNRKPAIGDISLPLLPGGPDWGLRDSEKAKVRPTLKSILSVPVFNPADPEGRLLGTLQVDSDLPLIESAFGDEQKRQIAERFADVVSLLLEASR
jgi:hypothetical protein